MKRVFALLCLVAVSFVAYGQTPAQLEQLKNLTPEQVEQLKQANSKNETPTTKKPVMSVDSERKYETVLKEDAKKQETDKDKLAREKREKDRLERREKMLLKGIAPTDSIVLTVEEFEEFKRLKDSKKSVFGHEIFRADNLTFAPSMSIPTPENYVISAGDKLILSIWGTAEAEYDLKVSPEGNISIPSVGLVNVAGLTITEAQKRIKTKLTSTVAGLADGTVHIKLTLGDIRSISVNIIGEAFAPGTYTLPSLATLFNALYAAGGVSDIGSLRNIKLYRAGKEVATLDVYDYLLNGKQEVNMPLKDNDQIVVMPYENLVQVAGKVKRPKFYELKKGETLANVVGFAGGFTGDAYSENLGVSRQSGGRQFSMHTVPREQFGEFLLYDRDSVAVGEILKTYSNRVSIEGAVWREGNFELSDKLKSVKQLIEMAEGLSDDAFAGRAQIIRTKPDRTLQIIAFNAGKILMGQDADIDLQKDDRVVISSINDLRQGRTVNIAGEVNAPGLMPYAENMTLEDIIILARGLKESASLANIEVARRVKDAESKEYSSKKAEIFNFSIPADISLEGATAAFTLEPYDEVYIRRSPSYSEQLAVTISGQVLFSGPYVMSTSSDKLSDLVVKAGGLTPEAYVKGASLRRQVSEQDVERITSLTKLTQRDRKKDDSIKIELIKIGDYISVGIDLMKALTYPESDANLTLRDGDILTVPTFNNTVRISGAVNYPNTTSYTPGARIDKYIAAAGGYSNLAKRKPFVVYMNGTVAATMGGVIPPIEPGCEIVVPQKAEREPMTTQGWIGISSSVVSMAAMITSLFK